jgi:hypothetical protein
MSCGVDGAMMREVLCGDRVSLFLPRRVISCLALGVAIVLVHDVVGADQELGETTRVQGECVCVCV